ncbi:MAG: CPBP family intramembrane glutamic endopeptidase [Sandaracinus sp.]
MRRLALVFYDPASARLRAGVRITIHLLALAVLLIVLALLGPALPPLLAGPLAFAGILGITGLAARFLDRRPFVDLGLRADGRTAVDLLAGTLVGTGAITLVAVLETLEGVSRYALVAAAPSALRVGTVGVFFVGVAIQEELVFRGYHLVNLTEGLEGPTRTRGRAAVLATVLAALGFGLAHAGNDGATMLATLQVALAGGTLLAVGFLVTGDLAFSIGLHFAWNFAQAVLGMPVSGFVLSDAALCSRTTEGAELWTGGAFGPEASLNGLAAMLVGTAASLAYARLRYGPLAVRLRERPKAATPSA